MNRSGIRKPHRDRRRIVIVEDHPLMREGLVQLVETEDDLVVVGTAANAQTALQVIAETRPDLVVMDITLPGTSGLNLLTDLHSTYPEMLLLVVSMHDEFLYAKRALRAGASGYIMKDAEAKDTLKAIRHVLSGHVYVSEKMAGQILQVFSQRRCRESLSPIDVLSDREFQVFRMIGEGFGTRMIAEQLHLSAKTVDVHKCNIKQKLGLKNASELVHYAVHYLTTETTTLRQ